jgi:8-oxoguanine deaminase
MSSILIKNADVIVTMDNLRQEIPDGALLTEENKIIWLGPGSGLDTWVHENRPDLERKGFDSIINARGCVVTPGLVNCHHHLWQSLTRGIATGPGRNLFQWLTSLYPIWSNLQPEGVYVSAKLALSELVLSGCTTASDLLYLYVNGVKIDDEIRAAQEVGVRFHPNRGSNSLGESHGGLMPDKMVEDEDFILKESVRAIEKFHDPSRESMLRIGLAPNMPNTVTADLMRETARIARSYEGVKLHTHAAESMDDERYTLEAFGKRPMAYCEWLDWVGEDVWFAHMVQINGKEIDWLAQTNTGVCHCPGSNTILASGIAPIRQMVDKNVRVGIGVDGSASNDSNHLLGEARLAMQLQRVGWPGFESSASRFTAREALELATLGGARVLQQEGFIGSLEVGKAADFVAYRVDDLEHAGGRGDPASSLVTCQPTNVWLSVINGKKVVEEGQFLPFELEPVIAAHNRISLEMIDKAGAR